MRETRKIAIVDRNDLDQSFDCSELVQSELRNSKELRAKTKHRSEFKKQEHFALMRQDKGYS